MVATVIINEKNTTAGTKTRKDGGTIRPKNADNATVDTADPLIIPGTGQEYSFEKWLLAEITVAPDTEITALEFYMDGANNFGTGVKLWGASQAAFDTTNGPTVPVETNDPPLGPDDATPMTDAFTWTSASPLTLGAGPFSGTGDIGDHLVLVMEVEPTATQGTTPAETATWEWDEI